jgi:hypothetical protein
MCYSSLPEDYSEFDKIDLQNNKAQFWTVNVLSFVLAAILIVAGCFIVFPLNIEDDLIIIGIALIVAFVGIAAYLFAHEFVHGIVMFAFTKVKPKFGFVGWAAYAGSTAYFDKTSYIIVALAPLVTFGIIFGVLAIFFHTNIWFWTIWLLQTINISGAAGDLFVTFKMFGYPKDILVTDTGLSMTVYSRSKKSNEGN